MYILLFLNRTQLPCTYILASPIFLSSASCLYYMADTYSHLSPGNFSLDAPKGLKYVPNKAHNLSFSHPLNLLVLLYHSNNRHSSQQQKSPWSVSLLSSIFNLSVSYTLIIFKSSSLEPFLSSSPSLPLPIQAFIITDMLLNNSVLIGFPTCNNPLYLQIYIEWSHLLSVFQNKTQSSHLAPLCSVLSSLCFCCVHTEHHPVPESLLFLHPVGFARPLFPLC